MISIYCYLSKRKGCSLWNCSSGARTSYSSGFQTSNELCSYSHLFILCLRMDSYLATYLVGLPSRTLCSYTSKHLGRVKCCNERSFKSEASQQSTPQATAASEGAPPCYVRRRRNAQVVLLRPAKASQTKIK